MFGRGLKHIDVRMGWLWRFALAYLLTTRVQVDIWIRVLRASIWPRLIGREDNTAFVALEVEVVADVAVALGGLRSGEGSEEDPEEEEGTL